MVHMFIRRAPASKFMKLLFTTLSLLIDTSEHLIEINVTGNGRFLVLFGNVILSVVLSSYILETQDIWSLLKGDYVQTREITLNTFCKNYAPFWT